MSGRRAEQPRDQTRQQAALADLGRRALAGMGLEELLCEAAETAARELGADRAAVLERTHEGRGMLVRAAHGFPEDVLGSELSAAPEELSDLGIASALIAPIGGRPRQFGTIGVYADVPRRFGEDDPNFLQALANVIGAAVERARQDERARDMRQSESDFRGLADTAPVMIWTTDERGLVTFVNEGWLRYTGTTLEEELGPSWSLGVHPDDAEEVLATWDDALAERRPWELEYRLRRSDGEYRWIVDRGVPRYEHGRYAGYVGTAIDIHERKLMEARLREVYEREHRIAETLQRRLLPERLPDIDGLDLVPRYLPAGSGAAVGGDWYDALERPDGRVALVVGDVVGQGLRAAAIMGQLRNAFRAYGLVVGSPAEVMARINRLVMTGGEEAMATLIYLVLDRETGEVAYTSAGHPPPLVLAPDGARFLEGGRSVPVGAAEPAVFRENTSVLPPGSSLLLYTDGLVERRDAPLERRLRELADAAGGETDDLDQLCDRVLDRMLGLGDPGDDVALLAVRPKPVAAERITMALPAHPQSLLGLRRRLGRFLHAAGASQIEAYEITLAVCEAAGNAIEHAYGPADATFEVNAAFEDGKLIAEVRDQGSWRGRRGSYRGRGLKIIELLMDEVQVSTERQGTVVRMRRRLASAKAA
jgi:PAS domain S-box-containing protein